MSDDEDPEVIADLQLRASSQYDSTRTRTANYGWTKPTEVEFWPCRMGSCSNMVGVTEETLHALDVHNRRLKSKLEAPINTEQCVFCDECKARGRAMAADRNRKHVDGLAMLIRELKGEPAPKPERERVLIEQIRHMHHPDVDALVTAIRERRAGPKSKAPRGKL